MNPFTFAVLAAAAAFSLQRAHAADLPVNYNHVEYKQTGNTYRWTPLNGPTPSSGAGVVFRGPTGIDTVQPKISTMERLPFDKRGTVPASQMAKVTSPFTKAAFGKALVMAGKVVWPIGVLMTAGEIVDYLKGADFDAVGKNADGEIWGRKRKEKYFEGFEYYVGNYTPAGTWSVSPQAAMQTELSYRAAGNPNSLFEFIRCYKNQYADWRCDYRSKHKDAITWNIQVVDVAKREVSGNEVTFEEFVGDDLADEIAKESGWPSSAARALQSALNTPGVTIETEPPVVTGPSSVPGSKTTTTTQTQVAPGTTTPVAPGTPGAQPATATTTTTTTNNAVYNNNQVTNTTTTTTVTNITNNITNQTDKTEDKEETKEDDKEEETPNDTPLSDIPTLYERKYPDGLSGIWSAKSAEIKQLPLFTLADQLMPTGLTGGTCPAWKVDLSFGGAWGDYGLQDVSPPCWIWDIAKVIIIASALILARALVFGG